MKDGSEDHEHDEIDEQQPVIIAGIGRFGQVVNRLVQMAGFKTTVLDNDLKTIQLMRRFGFADTGQVIPVGQDPLRMLCDPL